VTKPDRETAGFFDSSVFEKCQRTGDEALKRFLSEGLVGSSVTCVLVGAETAWRRWVRYEILKSFVDGKGLFGVSLSGVPDMDKRVDGRGSNPFSCLGYRVDVGQVRFKELNGEGKWTWSRDFGPMPLSAIARELPTGRTRAAAVDASLEDHFPVYGWLADDGYENLGNWAETAAKTAGR
jgi:hypothetical protein